MYIGCTDQFNLTRSEHLYVCALHSRIMNTKHIILDHQHWLYKAP